MADAAEAFRLLQAGRAEEALAAAARLSASEPGNARAHLARGLALRALGERDASLDALARAASLDPRDYAAAYEHGMALSLLGREPEAQPRFRRALELRPDFAPAHYALGMHAFSRGDWPAAVAALEAAAARAPANPGIAINLGLALAEAGDIPRAEARLRALLEHAPQVAAARHALGWVLHKAKRTAEALPHLEAALAANDDPRWRLDLAKALADAGRSEEAQRHFAAACEAAPHEPLPRVAFGRFRVSGGDFAGAAEQFRAAAALDPGNPELPMYLAQVELALGRWRAGWEAYAGREQRMLFEAESRRRGAGYRPPEAREAAGRLLVITAEQGLGDELFFLRFAPALRSLGARLAYRGDPRLHPLLARTGLFEALAAPPSEAPPGALAVLSGDLPGVVPEVETPPTLAIAPDPTRLEAVRRRLERAGPRPWTGVAWRAGTPRHVVAHALHKEAPIAGLFAAMPRAGTVVSLQRDGHFDELEAASRALGRPIYDFSFANDDLEDALALAALLDHHVAVSNTNIHLAAAAGASAHVLVPFPPEWRWGLAGDSPWFPGFRVYRQGADRDWSRAYATLASVLAAGSTSPG